nr:Zinc knuckle family protein [Ipomoea batatas]GME08918.1 Zinc knuckle family protein [Ipomoea batatas]
MTSRSLLGTNRPPTVEDEVNGGKNIIVVDGQNVGEDGGFDWLDEGDDLELNWDDEVENAAELVKGGETEISDSVGGEFSESMNEGSDDEQNLNVGNSSTPNILSDRLNQIDLEGEKDCVESEDELRSIGSNSDIEDQWRKTGAPPPLPPKYKPQPGRPKKLRRKYPIEKEPVPTKLGRIGEKKKCGLCGQHGHNKRRCKASKENTTISNVEGFNPQQQQEQLVDMDSSVQQPLNVDSSVVQIVEMIS